MNWLGEFARRLAMLWRRRQFDADLEEEMRLHLELRQQEQMQSGMAPDDARTAARRRFGNLTSLAERSRIAWSWTWLEHLVEDLRQGLRVLYKAPGFTIAAIVTLALGIGANTAIFTMVDTLMLRPLPVRNPSELTFLAFPRGASNFDSSFSMAEFRELDSQTRGAFSEMGAMIFGGLSGATGRSDGLTVDGETRPTQTLFVSGNFFQMLGLRPYLGRLILPSEGNTPGGDPVVVISYRYWQARFHGDPGVVGKPAFINGRPVTIVGVAPKGFLGLTPIVEMEAYLPLGMMTVETRGSAAFFTDPSRHQATILARLAPGIGIAQANAALAPVGQHLAKEYPRPGVGAALRARPLRPPGLINGPNPFPALAGLFLTLAGLVLALACLNVANLSLVRAAGRHREMAVRAALGGSRARLVRYLLTETILLALFGAAGGMIVGALALHKLSSSVPPTEVPLVFEFPFNARIFAYSLGVAMLAGVIAGIIPALRVSRQGLSAVLHEGGRLATAGRQRMRTSLVAVQVGGSLALLVIAGLFARSLGSVQHSDLGFNPANVLNVRLDPGEIGFTETQGRAFYAQLLAQVRALPGVRSTSLALSEPLADNAQDVQITVPGYVPPHGEQPSASYNAASSDFFKTLEIAVLEGRGFSDADTESSPRVALINQAMAERFWPNQNPIGRRFTRAGEAALPMEVIGVVRNSRTEDLFSPYGPVFYVPISQGYNSLQSLQIRTAGAPQAVAPEVLALVRRLAPSAPVLGVQTMTDAVNYGANGLFLFNVGAELTTALGLLGLTLAVVGIYGVMAYTVGQRTREIGVRVAFGAQRGDILWMVSRQGVTTIAIGLAFGLLAAMGVGRLVGNFLVGVGPTDAWTYATVSLLLSFVALLACFVPARRAMRVDPMVALRHE